MADQRAIDQRYMRRAIELAARGQGYVEPNPMVGCVIVAGDRVVGEGYHERYGGPHAEVNALAQAGPAAEGGSLYATLEPCRHTGKTPPCTRAILASGVARVVVAAQDPFPQVDGGGIAELQAAGLEVVTGVCEAEAQELLAPYLKLVTQGRPWVLGKWAMTLDGKIATRTGNSQWISSEPSRQIVHKLRGRVDAIIIGRRTAIADDPLLTARPAGARIATRIVLGSPPHGCQLLETLDQAPLMIIAGAAAEAEELAWASEAGAEVLLLEAEGNAAQFALLLDELGRRRMTNVLIEGGGGVLGAAFDCQQLDEAHVFVGPKLIGGQAAPPPLTGWGLETMADAAVLAPLKVEAVGDDAYLSGRLLRPPATE